MDKKMYLMYLITQMRADFSDQYYGSKSSSWQAHQEALKLDDPEYFRILKEILEEVETLEQKSNTYFLIACLGENLKDSSIIEFLLKKLRTEENESLIHLMFTKIYTAQVTFSKNNEVILKFLTDERPLIRQSAIRVLYLDRSNDTKVEKALLEVLDFPYDEFDIRYASASLAQVGSIKAIPYLERAFNEVENEEIKTTIEEAMKKLNYGE